MLGDHPIDVMLLATDLSVAKAFYADKLGLKVLLETDDFLTFQCGGDSRLVVTKSSTGTAEEQTKANWRVGDLTAEVADMQSRGVALEEYDEPGFKTVDGIVDVGFAYAAWFIDPMRNTLSLMQFKE